MWALGGASCFKDRVDRCGKTAIMTIAKKDCPFVNAAIVYVVILSGNKREKPHINTPYYGARKFQSLALK